jgi:hypothetical protein
MRLKCASCVPQEPGCSRYTTEEAYLEPTKHIASQTFWAAARLQEPSEHLVSWEWSVGNGGWLRWESQLLMVVSDEFMRCPRKIPRPICASTRGGTRAKRHDDETTSSRSGASGWSSCGVAKEGDHMRWLVCNKWLFWRLANDVRAR